MSTKKSTTKALLRPARTVRAQLPADRIDAINAMIALDNVAQDAHNVVLRMRRALGSGIDADIAFAQLVQCLGELKSDIGRVARHVTSIRDREVES